MLVVLYMIAALAAGVELLGLLIGIRRQHPCHLLFFVAVVIENLGYLALGLSTSVETAVLANKIVYLGGAFVPFFMLMTIADICKTKVPLWLQTCLVNLSFVVLGLVFSIGYSTIYYEDVRIKDFYGITYLVKTYGPMHNLYTILLLTEMAIAFFIVIRTLVSGERVSRKTPVILLIGSAFTLIVYIGERMIDLPIDLTPYSFITVGAIYLYISKQSQTYDMSAGLVAVYQQMKGYGYLTFDRRKRLMNCNDTAMELFPELRLIQFGSGVNETYVASPMLYDHVIPWLKNMDREDLSTYEESFSYEERFYRCKVSLLKTGVQKCKGYVVELVDETERQQYLEKLKLAEEEAIAANRAKSEFLANMSHEIRTPINAIIGMDTMILRESSEDQIREYAGYIDRAGHTLLALINDILDFSKIEAGKMDIVEDTYSLGMLVCDVVSMIGMKAKEKALVFNVEVDSGLPGRLCGDFVRLRQVMMNLLTNAVKYTEEGMVDLQIDGEEKEGERLALTIRVRDTGIGIRKEDMERLFEGFERLDTKKNRSVEGTGLGLAITRMLVDRMQGSIAVESVYGEGSTFTVVLPQRIVGTEKLGDWRVYRENRDNAPETILLAPTARVLVVDDNDMNLIVFEKLLKNTRIGITKARSGFEAIELVKKEHYDLIFLDHFMPRLDGVETLDRIRTMTGNLSADTPVVVLTANAVVGSRSFYLENGFADYLTKPIEYSQMIEVLRKYLSRVNKVEYAGTREEPASDVSGDIVMEKNESGDEGLIRREVGMEYAAGDENFYKELLAVYLEQAQEKQVELNSAYEREDGENYTILAHSLKSNSKMIGAVMLADIAYELEKAGKQKDWSQIRVKHGRMMEAYGQVLKEVEKILHVSAG